MKKFLSILLAAMLLTTLLAGCGSDNRTVLNVYNWGDYIDEEVLDLFEEQYPDIRINYEMFETNEDMYSKITNSSSVYDVIIPSDYIIERMINEGLLAKLNFDNIPNYQYIGDAYKNWDYDPDNAYSVPYMWGTLGILYNKTMVDEEDFGWEILWDEKYAGQILMQDSMRDTFCVAEKLLGFSCNTTDPMELEAAKQKLIEQGPLVLAYVGDEGKDKMIAGEAALSVHYAGDALYCMLENEDLGFMLPTKQGSNYFVDAMCVPANSPHKEEAEKFINFMCDTEISRMNTEYINYSTPQVETAKVLPDELKDSEVMYPPESALLQCEVFKYLGDATKAYDKAWTEVKAAV